MYCLRDHEAVLLRGEEVELERMSNAAWPVDGCYVGHGEVLLSCAACRLLREQRRGLSLLTGWRYRMHSVIELHGPRLHATSRALRGGLTFVTFG
ncbi:hypothetical protein IG631_02975 [Alternaria alternata]|jgi:hypothetical protein|nr:hypothetical protein IG631_02975 [Alternaria alternata]